MGRDSKPKVRIPPARLVCWQYVAVHIHTYYYCSGGWCSGPQDTKTTLLMRYGEKVTLPYAGTQVKNDGRYWTMLVQVTWYNASSVAFASETFYPDRTGKMYFDWVYDQQSARWEAQYWGNADMACHTWASSHGYCTPAGSVWGANLNTPTGNIYCLYASHP